LLLRPALSIFCSEQVTMNVGVYYLYQGFQHSADQSYRITDKVGQYNSLTGSVTGTANNGYGFSVGATYRFRKLHPPIYAPVEDTSSVPEEQEDLSPEMNQNSSFVAPVQPVSGNRDQLLYNDALLFAAFDKWGAARKSESISLN